ncbi:MAG: adenylate kinase [Firmicutes bacterium]|nr:adenylate kinase [Bacillota bacterium]
MRLVLIGCPGAGKGTQAKVISKHFGLAHISTGDLLRNEIAQKTELGLKITSIMESGKLVSDEIVSELLMKRVKEDDCKNGYILDGYPRNVAQADNLEKTLGSMDKVIYIQVEDGIIIERMSGRRGCPKCGHMYHEKYNPPKKEGICNECGTPLVQRKDDVEETVKHRLEVYHNETSPIIEYYDKKHILYKVNGVGDIDKISAEIIGVLESFNK